MNAAYRDTVRLLIEVAPFVFEEPQFAMKGGTALNLFVQDLPRLSVDIDVVFTKHTLPRDQAIEAITQGLARVADKLSKRGLSVEQVGAVKEEVKLRVASERAVVKVEVNVVFRGTLLPVQTLQLVPQAQQLFEATLGVPALAVAELYGGKLVAALDRQHPRDLFDVLHMQSRFGLPEQFVDCFVAYLAGHNRPLHEVLNGRPKNIEPVYHSDFAGMTVEEVPLEQLVAVQATLPQQLRQALLPRHREFLLSLVALEPNWALLPFERMVELPAIRWKLENLTKLRAKEAKKFGEQHSFLARVLGD